MKKELSHYKVALKEAKKQIKLYKSPDFAIARTEANIIRYLHILEKGLSLSAPRLGFGIAKIDKLFEYVDEYLALGSDNLFCIYMTRDAVRAYLNYHKERSFSSPEIDGVREKLMSLEAKIPESDEIYGGTLTLQRESMSWDISEIENFFKTRHSIREFSGEPVSEEDIRRAVDLAKLCPSACNRQCARVYSVEPKKYMSEMKTDLQGIGGFADDVDRFLLITAKETAYDIGERKQAIVSASIFAGYMTLALHTYGIASCVVQRSLSINPVWDAFKEKNGIPEDEQVVLMIAVGKYKETTTVPVSKRFPTDVVYKKL